MSVSTRRERAEIFPYTSTNDGGYMTSGYGPSRGTFFCRVSPVAGDELTVAEQADHRERCTFEFADSVTVEHDDMIQHRGDQWKVESPTPRRNLATRALIVRAVRTEEEPAITPA